ncbi:MAG: hypothetical protein AB1813_07020 [Verrucomicrobiota bacterium]
MSLINDALKRASKAHKENAITGGGPPPLQPAESGGSGGSWKRIVLLVLLLACVGALGWTAFKLYKGQPTAVAANTSTNKTSATKSTASPTAAASTNNAATRAVRGTDAKPASAESTSKSIANAVTAPLKKAAEVADQVKSSRETGEESNAPAAATTPTAPTQIAKAEPTTELAPAKTEPKSDPPAATAPAAPATVAAASVPKGFPPLKLQGIFFRLSNPSVLINGKTLYRDGTIEGARVVDIERNAVTMEFEGQKQTLTIGQK